MRYIFGFMCVLALGVMGCSETAGTGGSGGGGVGVEGGMAGVGGMPDACASPDLAALRCGAPQRARL
jgi:hypothetical protein